MSSSEKVLVVIDVQNDFVTGSLGSAAAVEVIPNICKKIEDFDGGIIVTQDTHDSEYLKTQEGHNLPIVHCIEDTWGHNIERDVFFALIHGYVLHVINKTIFGANVLPSVVTRTTTEDLKEIIVIGLVTDICVITNVLLLKTFFPELTITVDASCCAGTTPENHAAALQVMRSCQINVIND